VARAIGIPEFGLLFIDAESTGVDARGIITESVAASTLLKNGQKAFALLGKRDIANATIANPVINKAKFSNNRYASRFVLLRKESRSCGLKLMES